MATELRLACDSTADGESLYRWLQREPAVRADGRLARATSPDPDEMGTLLDVITLVLGSGLSAGQLALAIAAWRTSRPRPPALTITRVGADGETIRVEVSDPDAIETALRRLEQM